MKFVSRKDWGAKPPKSRRAMPPKQVTHFFLHHAAATYPSGPEAMRRIQRFHQDSRGWADYAYNWGVWDDGTIFEGRGWGAQGGHTRGWNTKSVAVCYMGDGGKKVPKAALNAILRVANEADRHFGRNLIRQGHRDVGSTACPGNFLYAWWGLNATSGDGTEDAPEKPSDAAREPKPTKKKSGGHPGLRDGWKRHLARLRRAR